MQTVDALELSAGDTVLIAGAAGGVGSLAVQLAAAAGATVLAPGLPEDENYLRELGVAEILPREGSVVGVVGQSHPEGVDAVVDLVNFEPGTYDSILKPAGRLSSPTNAAGTGPGRTNVMASAAPETLGAVAEQLDAGTLTVHIQRTFNLAEAPEALDALRTGHTQGKLAVRLV